MNERHGSAVMEDYLFDSLHGALTFAYRYSGQQYSPSLMAQMMRGPMKSGKGLSGLDGAGQAGIIRGLVARLDIYEQKMIAARFSAVEREYIEARLYLVPVVIACMPTGMHSRRATDLLVQKWFGLRLNIQGVAEEAGKHRNTISPQWRVVKDTLNGLWDRAEGAAFRELQDAGIIP